MRAARRDATASRSTWAARAATSAWCSTASPLYSSRLRDRVRPAGQPSRACARARSAPAAARSAGSTPAGSCRSARRARAPTPAPPATAAAARSATITDANVVLGRLDPDYFLGGAPAARRRAPAEAALDRLGDRARRAIASRPPRRCCASPTRTWPTRSASSPSSRASTRASHALIAFGRRRPDARAPRSPTRSDMRPRASCRRSPGVCSAFGALAADCASTRSAASSSRARRARRRRSSAALFDALEESARRDFARPGQHGRGARTVRALDRHALPGPELRAGGRGARRRRSTARVAASRRSTTTTSCYEEFYGYRLEAIPIELVRLMVVALGGRGDGCRARPTCAAAPATRRPPRRPRRVLPRRRLRADAGAVARECAGRRHGARTGR